MIHNELPSTFSFINMNNPMPFFRNRIMKIKPFEDYVNRQLLSSLSITCNKHFLHSISCIWVCSEFFHRKGEIAFDIIIQRYLPKFSLKLFNIT